jgi:hypothetical protein
MTRISRSLLVVLFVTMTATRGFASEITPSTSPSHVQKFSADVVKQWGVFEKELRSNNEYSPAEKYRGVVLTGTFTGPKGVTYTVPGFWDGGNAWRIRFSPTQPGNWSFSIESSDKQLDSPSNDGSFTVVPPTLEDIATNPNYRGFLRLSSDRRYFTYADGTPFFWLGGTLWSANSKNMHYPTDFKAYLDNRKTKNFTVVQIVIGRPATNYGGSRYTGWNDGGQLFNHRDDERTRIEKVFQRLVRRWKSHPFYDRYGEINPENFKHLDLRLQHVIEAGMVPYVVFAWSEDFDGMPINALKAYVRYVVARYQAYNVIWCIAGEHYLSREKWKFVEVGRYLYKLNELRHLTTIHGGGIGAGEADNFPADFRGELWYDFISDTAWDLPNTMYERLSTSYKTKMPFVMSESRYDGNEPDDRYKVVKYAWASMMAGAAGYTYGAEEIRAWDHRKHESRKFEGYQAGLSLTRLDLPSSFQMKYLADFFTKREWWKLVPNNDLVNRGKCLTELGEQYVVWLNGGGTVTVDLSQVSGPMRLRWLNPTTGTRTRARTILGGGKRAFVAPFDGDAVLSIDAIAT